MRGWSSNRVRRIVAAGILILTGCASQARAQTTTTPPFVPGEILVKFKAGVSPENVTAVLGAAGLESIQHFATVEVHRCRIPAGADVLAAVKACQADASIAFAEPNYIYSASRTPNDPRFAELWGLNNDTDTDMDAPEAWDTQTGSANVLVAVIDTGVDYRHEDLSANAWKNHGESGNGRETNGRDDDGNGFVDDVFGWNFAGDNNDPMDDNGHGSHVAGTIAAAGDNRVGVVGVNWRASVMACKFLSANGSGTASDAVEAIMYAANNGARVLNNSWGGGGFSQALRDAIEFARQRDAVFVAAAGNEGRDNDAFPTYPANYDVANVLSVAACDRQDALASFSNFGRTTVDLAAPGVDILSSTPGNGYRVFSGTSMATPHTSGAAALVLAQVPTATYREVMVRLSGSVDPKPAFESTTLSGGRLNVAAALAPTPKVAFVTRLDATTADVGPYRIDAEAVGGDPIADVRLEFAVQNGTPTVVPMQSTTANVYTAQIPVQAVGAQVSYAVEAVDQAGNTARSRTYTFRVGENAGVPGCGGFNVPSANTTQARVLVVLVNVLLLLLGIQVGRRVMASRRSSTVVR